MQHFLFFLLLILKHFPSGVIQIHIPQLMLAVIMYLWPTLLCNAQQLGCLVSYSFH